METITIDDLKLINSLSTRIYRNNSINSNADVREVEAFRKVKDKLRKIADFFSSKYSSEFGPFETNASPEHNPISRGNKLLNVWSTLFKGSINKQYAAQISFVIEKEAPYLNVGFYFGRASARSLSEEQRKSLEANLKTLAEELSNTIMINNAYEREYNSLFDLGFSAYSDGKVELPKNWLNSIRISPQNSQITAKIYPNDLGIIEMSILDFYVSLVIFLMGGIKNSIHIPERKIKPPTPEQSAKKAEKNALIGLKGEEYVIAVEREKLLKLGISKKGYPRHRALESIHYGYDVLSLDENENDIFIEVKTTARRQDDDYAKRFFITNHELQTLESNNDRYILRRVYDIENEPTFEDLDVNNLIKEANGYIITY
ncbi:MAG: DUF3883 domain-containing protein [Leadbetterella sp.]|nr:DUF3883 domain-containing protein [Leadbetterella sp.]